MAFPSLRGDDFAVPHALAVDPLAARLFEDMMTSGDFAEFLTLVAYDHID